MNYQLLDYYNLGERKLTYVLPEVVIERTPYAINHKHYLIKTVETEEERAQAHALRTLVFKEEVCGVDEVAVDYDRFDKFAETLIIKDTNLDKVIGTYRLISSLNSSEFYSQTEFNMTDFISRRGIKLELSRACIHPKHRNGIVISLLWKGLTGYARTIGAKYLFGCSSVWNKCPNLAKGIHNYLHAKGHLGEKFLVSPILSHRSVKFESSRGLSEEQAKAALPPLMRSYLKAGAKIYGKPAYDSYFECFDFFTIIDLEDLSEGFKKRYNQ
jgi:putative hemolysin